MLEETNDQQEQPTPTEEVAPSVVSETDSTNATEEAQVVSQDQEPPAVEQPQPTATPAMVLSRAEQYNAIKPGMTIRVHERITDINAKGEEKKRIQVFEGIVLARKHNNEIGATITVRKISNGVGVEKIFPLNSPDIEKIEIIKQASVRQSRPYYLRTYKKRLQEKRIENTSITAV